MRAGDGGVGDRSKLGHRRHLWTDCRFVSYRNYVEINVLVLIGYEFESREGILLHTRIQI